VAKEIEVSALGQRAYEVRVTDRGRQTVHRVEVPERLADGTPLGSDLERAVQVSFEFLLEREPAASILRAFSLDDITTYFPEYPAEFARRLT
jgi:hypothetical protein